MGFLLNYDKYILSKCQYIETPSLIHSNSLKEWEIESKSRTTIIKQATIFKHAIQNSQTHKINKHIKYEEK